MSIPAVSVIVTVYNREAYLAACLDSILASTFQDFEVVVVDDKSRDGSVEIAETYAARDPRIRFHRNETNLGDYPNRRHAAELAKGKYLKYVDSDDLIYRHSLSIMVEAMEAHPDAALGLCHSMQDDEQPYPWYLEPQTTWQKHFLGRGCLGCGPTGTIFRRDVFFEIGGFRDWGVLNDTDLWLRMTASRPLILLPPGLVWWRRHDNQEFTKDGAGTFYLEKGFLLECQALESTECPLHPADRKRALEKIRRKHARRLWSLLGRYRQPALAWKLFRASDLDFFDLCGGLKGYL